MWIKIYYYVLIIIDLYLIIYGNNINSVICGYVSLILILIYLLIEHIENIPYRNEGSNKTFKDET